MRWWLVGALALGCSCSPYGGGSFTCTDNAQCAPNGTCSSGFCAFPDPNCPSMLKYGDSSGPNSGKCVGANSDIDGGMVDADTSTPDGAVCYGTSLVHACFAEAPTGTKTINAAINTMTSNQCATLVGPNANAWCVIAGSTVSVTGTVQVTGNRPLVLLSTGTMDVGGTLDVASHRGGSLGPDADATGCNAGTVPTNTSGGAGGSFGGFGGAGTAAGGGGATGGVAGAKLTPTALRGGCPGQKGAGGGGGNGGHGGGAIWLFASTSITIGGNIDASGSSGDGGATAASSGGGAGGSGGFVGLESPSVTLTGSIFANGGGGGEGSGPASTGAPGTDSPNVTTAATGGSGGSFSGDGGNGSLGTVLDGSPAAACGGCAAGGAGGGGAGIIKLVPTQTIGGQLSPPAT